MAPLSICLLIRASSSKVDHGLPELILGYTPIIVVIKHSEGCFYIVHLKKGILVSKAAL